MKSLQQDWKIGNVKNAKVESIHASYAKVYHAMTLQIIQLRNVVKLDVGNIFTDHV